MKLTLTLTALVLATGLASAALAQDFGQLPDDQLLDAVVAATDDQDADRLLQLMLEVQARGLLMFPTKESCEFTYPDTAFFRNEIFRGAVRWGHGTGLREKAMAENNCGCIYDLGMLDTFTQSIAEKMAEELSAEDFNLFRRFRSGEWDEVNRRYQNFQSQICGE